MAVIKGDARQTTSVERKGEGVDVYMRMLRDGTVGVADLIALWSLEGRVFTTDITKARTTAMTFGAGTLDVLEHDLHVSVPASVVIIPLELTMQFDAFGSIQIVECCWSFGVGSTAGTGTASTPWSSNINAGITSACTITAGCATGVDLTTIREVWHDGIILGYTRASHDDPSVQERFSYKALDAGVLQVVGPSEQLVAYASAQVGIGYITFKYAELPVGSIE